MSTKSYTKSRFSANDAVLVLIDHQSGIMQLVHDYSPAEFRNNVIGLAKLGKVFKVPTAAMQAVEAGYNVYGVVDASGALEVTIRENAVARMRDHGITPINWTTVAAELQRNWTLPTGKGLGQIFHDHYHSYGLLMDSFESVPANVINKAS